MGVLLVTGSSRGIGAEICRLGAERGWAVCVNYASSAHEAEAVVAEIEGAGGQAIAVRANVSVPRDVDSLFEKVDVELGPVTGLVNNAGVMGSGGPVDELDAERTRRMFEVNTLGPFLCCRAAVKRMAKRHGGQGGAIVNISSAAAKHGGPGSYVDYAASKAAVDTLDDGPPGLARLGDRANAARTGRRGARYRHRRPVAVVGGIQIRHRGDPRRLGRLG
jgi:NAD(P)-dependent dehydrogenase (short-subunit alcohol dehydrogenase family)